MQTNFATKILFSFNLTSIKENAESSGQEIKTLLTPALEQMVSAINDNGLDGASISYTGDIGLGNNAAVNASIAEMRQLLLDKITPLAKNGKIFFRVVKNGGGVVVYHAANNAFKIGKNIIGSSALGAGVDVKRRLVPISIGKTVT